MAQSAPIVHPTRACTATLENVAASLPMAQQFTGAGCTLTAQRVSSLFQVRAQRSSAN